MESTIISVCIISLAISVSENLTAGTKLGNQIKFILSLMLIAVIFRPFSDNAVLPDISGIPDIGDIQVYSDDVRNQELANQISENISEALRNEMEKKGFSPAFIETEVNISESDSISINRVTVGTDNFPEAEKIIKENLGEETEVLNAYS